MSKTLNYCEFRNASYRNLTVCKELLKLLQTCEAKDEKYILHKTYYLSGYIIEFCYKFALFSHLGLSKTENVYKHGDEGFQKKWTEHSFSKLQSICEENNLKFSNDIPFLGAKIQHKNVEKLIKSWDVQIRYSLNIKNNQIELNRHNLIDLIAQLEEIVNKINSKFS